MKDKSQTDWARVDAMTDDEIDYTDCPEATEEMFGRMTAREPEKIIDEITDTSVTPSCGNIFADLGLPDPEGRQRRAAIVYEIHKTIESNSFSRKDAAKILNLSPGKLSKLLRGNLDELSDAKLKRFERKIKLVASRELAKKSR